MRVEMSSIAATPEPQVALAVCAECEVALLQLHDFEELITYLKVSSSTFSVTNSFDSHVMQE